MDERDLELEEDCPGLRQSAYKITSPKDPKYNCIAFAVGDVTQFWDDLGLPAGVRVKGYYWPPGAPTADTLLGWVKIFEIHGYSETQDSTTEPEYEKIAIYGSDIGAEHVARQKASGIWVSKMGKGVDIEHTLSGLEGDFPGRVVKIMKRKCQGGKRVL
ncbi:MAG TPA: hypothetical protein VNX26_14520 [Candidatus Acidoferrum sp.]|nr:hypothetical protein [Candidatus Acidoferrum sp.]